MKKTSVLLAICITSIFTSCGEPTTSETKPTENSKTPDNSKTAEAPKGESTNINGVEIKIIPGLVAVDVHGSMEKIGFETEKRIAARNSHWTSTMSDDDGDFKVIVTGNGPEKITSVDARYQKFNEPNMERAAEFMQFVSTLPYDNANPEIAKSWVGRYANKGGDTLISGVKFRITARNFSRVLYINVPD